MCNWSETGSVEARSNDLSCTAHRLNKGKILLWLKQQQQKPNMWYKTNGKLNYLVTMGRACWVFNLMHCSEKLTKPENSMIPTHEYSNKMLNWFFGKINGN